MKTLKDIIERVEYYIKNSECDPTKHRSIFLCRFLDKESIYKIICECKCAHTITKENWIPEVFSYNVINNLKSLYKDNINFTGIIIYKECCWILEDEHEKTKTN